MSHVNQRCSMKALVQTKSQVLSCSGHLVMCFVGRQQIWLWHAYRAFTFLPEAGWAMSCLLRNLCSYSCSIQAHGRGGAAKSFGLGSLTLHYISFQMNQRVCMYICEVLKSQHYTHNVQITLYSDFVDNLCRLCSLLNLIYEWKVLSKEI